MKSVFPALFLLILIAVSCQKPIKTEVTDYTQFVDPYIGSDYHGHVFVGANVPFGAVQLGPNNETQGWDWCSGYHYSDSILIGFAHTHLSGTGIGDLGDVVFMPVTNAILCPEPIQSPTPGNQPIRMKKKPFSPDFIRYTSTGIISMQN
jgi:putative alpha-1,2-mannosidase